MRELLSPNWIPKERREGGVEGEAGERGDKYRSIVCHSLWQTCVGGGRDKSLIRWRGFSPLVYRQSFVFRLVICFCFLRLLFCIMRKGILRVCMAILIDY